MEEVGCLFCKTHVAEVFLEENGYAVRRCPRCGLIYLSPRPTPCEMAHLYDAGASGGAVPEEHVRARPVARLIARHTLNIIRRFRASGDILEVGAGGGHFLREARRCGFAPHAVEVSGPLATFLSAELAVETENCAVGQRDFFRGRSFDVIYHRNVLSHLHAPLAAFAQFGAKLKDGGVMVFETGNLGGVSAGWVRFAAPLHLPEHLYFFSERHVRQLLKETGFELVALYRHTTLLPIAARKIAAAAGNVAARLSGRRAGKEKSAPGSACSDTHVRPGKAGLSNLVAHLNFFASYRLARVCPQTWPAAVIYVARKRA